MQEQALYDCRGKQECFNSVSKAAAEKWNPGGAAGQKPREGSPGPWQESELPPLVLSAPCCPCSTGALQQSMIGWAQPRGPLLWPLDHFPAQKELAETQECATNKTHGAQPLAQSTLVPAWRPVESRGHTCCLPVSWPWGPAGLPHL